MIIDVLNFKVSEDFTEREKDILKSDCVVVFFTPEYKNIINEMQLHRGVYREYEYIQALINQKSTSSVFPVLFKGDLVSSIPSEFRKLNYFDLSKCSYTIRGKNVIQINSESRPFVTNFIASIIKRTDDNFEVKEFTFSNDDDKYNNLLHNTESDDTLPPQCMIKIGAYEKIFRQQVYFVVGRKGSGKTTLFESIKKLDPTRFKNNYKALLPIKAEHINIESIYNFVS